VTLTLTAAEIAELTDRHTRPAQIKRLRAMGVPFLDDPKAGRIVVLREALMQTGTKPPANEPDFSVFGQRA
jgi:hypothetical protein